MGYTHYWRQFGPLKDWDRLRAFAVTVVAHLPEHSTSAGGYYSDAPLKLQAEFKEDQIWIEGGAANTRGVDLSHESFVLDRDGKGFQFCKTARKPYDLVAAAILLQAMLLHPGIFVVSTDGDCEDWIPVLVYHNRMAGVSGNAVVAVSADIGRIAGQALDS